MNSVNSAVAATPFLAETSSSVLVVFEQPSVVASVLLQVFDNSLLELAICSSDVAATHAPGFDWAFAHYKIGIVEGPSFSRSGVGLPSLVADS